MEIYFLEKNLAGHVQLLILAIVEKGEVIPDNVAPKSDFLLFVKNY